MQCNACHALLPAGARRCPACGAPTPYNAFDAGLHDAPTAFVPRSAPMSMAQPAAGYAPGPAAYVPERERLPGAPPERRGLLKPRNFLLACAALLLVMVGGLGLITYAVAIHPAQLKTQATATTRAIFTAAANQATVTAQASTHGTATAQAQATAQAMATVTAQQNVYNQATKGTPVLNDPLAGQDRYQWDQYQTTDGGGCTFTGGALHSSLSTKQTFVPCTALATNFSDFTFQVQMRILAGDAGGILFRTTGTNPRGYLFYIARDGNYGLFTSNGKNANAILGGPSSAIKTGLGQVNLLTVIAHGHTLTLYLNKQYVNTTTDSSFASGRIGVFALDENRNTEVAFSNAQVWV